MQEEYCKSPKACKDLKLVLGWGDQLNLTEEESVKLNEARERLMALSFNELITTVRFHYDNSYSQKKEPLPVRSKTKTGAG